MAGGSYASVVVCPHCLYKKGALNPANRNHEGLETDWYTCTEGHQTGITWENEILPRKPLWPPSQLQLESQKEVSEMLNKGATHDEIMGRLLELRLFDDL